MGENIIGPGCKPKIRGKADIIICVDGTGSMIPTKEGLITNLNKFAENLVSQTTLDQSPIDWRAKFYLYRDVEVDSQPFQFECPWISDADELKKRINDYFVPSG